MLPTIVITRPAEQGQAFAVALQETQAEEIPILLAPLMEIVPVDPVPPIGALDHLIFTSVNGVQQSSRLQLPKSAVAWCVGEKTADAASALGFETRIAGGNSRALLNLLIAEQPKGRILHLHGAHVAGTIVSELQDAGFCCEGRIVYDQPQVPPSKALLSALSRPDSLVVPLFSLRSARLLAEIKNIVAPLTLIGISPAVAPIAQTIPHERLIIAENPDRPALVRATVAAFRSFLPPKTP